MVGEAGDRAGEQVVGFIGAVAGGPRIIGAIGQIACRRYAYSSALVVSMSSGSTYLKDTAHEKPVGLKLVWAAVQ